tara:strand:- start:14040 stop:14825 length:786 start_codon:yes stop_codon:yes gene_type:complete
MEDILVAILAKDKEYCLNFYLKCLLNQTVDKKKIHLYIKTNDNKDKTQEILEIFIKEHGDKYASVYYNYDSISDKLKQYSEHEWNVERFKILSKIRQESINFAIKKQAHYFIADCDNFIVKDTLEYLYNFRNLGVVGPMLRLSKHHYYSNYHNVATNNGYYQKNDEYFKIWDRKVQGMIRVDTLHCTYFINKDILKEITYDDNSNRYEYVIFSDNLRKKHIPQYLINSRFFGFLFLNDQIKTSFHDFIETYWKTEYASMKI